MENDEESHSLLVYPLRCVFEICFDLLSRQCRGHWSKLPICEQDLLEDGD